MANILVIEDERDIREILEYNLRQAGHHVVLASTATEGLELAKTAAPDLVLLDLMLPDRPGTEVCKALKAAPSTASIRVVVLTARGEEIDRVVGFELGVDDYVTKPFSVRELVLRVQAVLRRGASEPPGAPAERADVEFGALRIDRNAHRVWVANEEIELTALELRLLLTLYDRRNRVQSRDVLLRDVWSMDGDIHTRTVDTHVKRLREKLGHAGAFILTIRGTGYRFAHTLEEVGP